jgi:hypothetical protein
MEPRTKKILFGCLGGCGFVVLLFVGSCVGLGIWLNSPGEVLEPQVLLGQETSAYVEWTLRLEDPGTAEFVEGMMQRVTELSRQSNSPLPDGMEQFLNNRQMKSARKDLKKLFPMVVAWTARPADRPGEDEHLFTASARGLGHRMIMLDWILGWVFRWAGDIETVRHGGEKILLLKESNGTRPACFIHKGIVFVATDLESARRTLDRLDRPADGSAAGSELGVLFGGLPAGPSLRGALTNRGGELRRILDTLDLDTEQVEAETWDEIRGATIVANFRDEEVFGGAVELYGPDTGWAQAHAATVGAALEELFQDAKIDFSTEIHQIGNRVQIGFNTVDLFDQIEDLDRRRD